MNLITVASASGNFLISDPAHSVPLELDFNLIINKNEAARSP